MGIEFVCPACHGTLRVAADAAGRVVRCGNCLATLRVPAPPPDVPPTPPGADDPRPGFRPGADDPPPVPRRRAAEPVAPADDPGRAEARRPRRRRPPPPPAGRGAVFWVLATLGVFALLVVAACGGALALLQPKWRPHQSDAGGFAVELPADPRPDMAELAPVNGRPDARVEGTVLVVKLEAYTVTYADLDPDPLRPADDDLLDQAVKGIADGAPGARVLRADPVRADGFPAREVVLTGPDGTYIARVVLAGRRVYVLAAGGAFTTADGNERVRRFLASFKVTDPKLRAEARLGPVLDVVRKQKAERDRAAPRQPEPAADEPAEADPGPPRPSPR